MATERITAFDESGLNLINRKLETFDLQQKQIMLVKNSLANLNASITDLQNRKQTVGADNLSLTWTGATQLVSWPAAFVYSKEQETFAIPAGSVAALSSTAYWFAWSPSQATMSFNTNLQTLNAINNLIVICQITTGTSGQSGLAGGGGTDPGGVGPIGKEYFAVY